MHGLPLLHPSALASAADQRASPALRVCRIQHFGEMLANIFGPLFEVTVHPASHPSLHRFLQQCVGFDIVDDESLREKSFTDHLPLPDQWNGPIDPPYAYFA